MEKLLELIKEQNDKDHAEIKDDLKWLRRNIAPHVIANRRAIVFILAVFAAVGCWKTYAAF